MYKKCTEYEIFKICDTVFTENTQWNWKQPIGMFLYSEHFI